MKIPVVFYKKVQFLHRGRSIEFHRVGAGDARPPLFLRPRRFLSENVQTPRRGRCPHRPVLAQTSRAAIFAKNAQFRTRKCKIHVRKTCKPRVGAGIARPQEAVSILQMIPLFQHDYKFAPARRVTARRDRDGICNFENARRFMETPAEFAGSCTAGGQCPPLRGVRVF